jgi:hypothetical protein
LKTSPGGVRHVHVAEAVHLDVRRRVEVGNRQLRRHCAGSVDRDGVVVEIGNVQVPLLVGADPLRSGEAVSDRVDRLRGLLVTLEIVHVDRIVEVVADVKKLLALGVDRELRSIEPADSNVDRLGR